MVTKMMDVHRRPEIFSLKAKVANKAVATISKFPKRDAEAALEPESPTIISIGAMMSNTTIMIVAGRSFRESFSSCP